MKIGLRNRLARLLTLASSLLVLTGCVATGSKTADTSKRIYFSHSIDQSVKPDLFNQLPTDELSTAHPTQNGSELVLYFDNDSSVVRADDIERLQSFLLSFNEQQMPVFLISGHTDSNHSDQYNIGLSDRRADSTRQEMLEIGVAITDIVLRGLGETAPIASNESDSGRKSNRRAVIQVIDNSVTREYRAMRNSLWTE